MKKLRDALDLIREEVEQHLPGVLPSSEMFITATAEAAAFASAYVLIAIARA